MNFFCDSKGTIFHVDPEPIYQNSAGANELYFVGAFPSSAQVTVSYKLPNGLYTEPKLMTSVTDSTLEITDQYGKGFSVWKEVLGQSVSTDGAGNIVYGQDYTVTENCGKVDVQFVIYASGQGARRLGTASSSFEVGKGVPIILPDGVENDILSQILSSLQTILQDITKNTADIEILDSRISSNELDIVANRERIATSETNISKNANNIALLTEVQYQSGLQIIQPIEDAYSERVTANGENILDWQGNGSTARLLKVVGDTQATKNIFNFEKVTFKNNTGYDNLVFEKVGNSLIFKSINGGNNYFSVRDGNDGLAPTAFYFKPNTTYTSFVTINVSTLSNTDYDLKGAGEMSCSLFLQTVANFDTTGTKVAIVDGYGLRRVETQTVGTFTLLTTFTTPEDLSAHKFVSTRIGNNIQVTYTNLMIVEGEYTEETMPKYVQGFDGLKSASFQGVVSKNADGTKESILSLPNPIDCGLGLTIDFENQKILNYGVEITLTGNEETIGFSDYVGKYGVFFFDILPTKEKFAQSVSTDGNPNKSGERRSDINSFWIGTGSSGYTVTWLGILDILGFTKNWVDRDNYTQEERLQAIGDFRAYLSQRYANGNPVKIRYVSSTLQSETPFTDEQKAVGNEYTVWTDGTEQVIGNASDLYEIYPTLTQEYVLVMDIKETAQETVDETITQALQEAY